MSRFILIACVSAIVAAGLMFALARSNGLDPLAPEVRTIALVSLLVAAYVGVRAAMMLNRLFDRHGDADDEDGVRRPSAFRRWGRDPMLDARLDARRARVARAQAAKADATDPSSEG